MPELPYDNISHIDMHMKLLDEETLLVSRYPDGVADGPQINQNINYVLNNFNMSGNWNITDDEGRGIEAVAAGDRRLIQTVLKHRFE
jgi:hypothetical protein